MGATFRPHAPIFITSNIGFTITNGVVGGQGTVSQPYIISGWEITQTDGGIGISGTTAYFIIRNVYVHNVYSNPGITLSVRNGQVDNSTVAANNGPFPGISITNSTNIIVDGNSVSSNPGGGIFLRFSDSVVISRNNVSDNGFPDNRQVPAISGIETQSSTNVIIRSNHLISNDILPSGSPFQLSSLTITSDNTVNGVPVAYHNGCSGTTVTGGPPQEQIFVSCTNIHVVGTVFSGTGFGVQLLSVDGAELSGDTFANNVEGIRVYNSTAITINTSNLSINNTGIEIEYSSNITLQGNNITSGNGGLPHGIVYGSTGKVTISQNQLEGTDVYGSDPNGTITNNLVLGAAVDVTGGNVTDNSIMNGGIYYRLPSCSCPANIISGNVVQNSPSAGITVVGSYGFTGVLNITANDLSDNNVGLSLSFAGGVENVYHNNFISNPTQVTGEALSWDNGYPSGGNYWSDFPGKDNCSGPKQDICPSPDGIADTPYLVEGSSATLDNYPLMKPFGPADMTRPSWPAGSALLGYVGNTEVTLTWNAVSDDTGILNYQVYNGNTLIATVPGWVHSFRVFNLTSATVYVFRVEAMDAWGNTSNPGLSATVKTSGGISLVGTALLQEYWPLIVAAGAAAAVLLSVGVWQRRKKLRNQASSNHGTNPSNPSFP